MRPTNPRRKKRFTREQAERRQAKAVQFLRNVVGDPDLADEIEGLSVDEYAGRKGFELSNPSGKGVIHVKQQEFLEKVKGVVTEAVKEARLNPHGRVARSPAGPSTPGILSSGYRAECSAQRTLDTVLDAVDDALTALDKGREDEAADILDEVLDKYGDEDED